MILITGETGKVGSELVRQLFKAGVSASAGANRKIRAGAAQVWPYSALG